MRFLSVYSVILDNALIFALASRKLGYKSISNYEES